jgi:hypothetical protein
MTTHASQESSWLGSCADIRQSLSYADALFPCAAVSRALCDVYRSCCAATATICNWQLVGVRKSALLHQSLNVRGSPPSSVGRRSSPFSTLFSHIDGRFSDTVVVAASTGIAKGCQNQTTHAAAPPLRGTRGPCRLRFPNDEGAVPETCENGDSVAPESAIAPLWLLSSRSRNNSSYYPF